jgi:hypothetical protein
MKNTTRKNNKTSKLCVVFDIDETILVYLNDARRNQIFRSLNTDLFDYAQFYKREFVVFRPGFRDFITYAKRKKIDIAIWTYGDKKYAEFIDRLICLYYGFRKSPFVFVYSNSEIKEDIQNGRFEKDMRRIFDAYPGRFNISNTFLVDNKPSNIYHQSNSKNGFIVESFNPLDINLASKDDLFTILKDVCNKIIKHKGASNIPIFEKENIQSMELDKYYKQYINKDTPLSIMSTDNLDFDEQFTLIK